METESELSGAQKRSILLEHRLGIDARNIGELCRKYGLSRSAFQRLRRELGEVYATEEELVVAGVHGGARDVASLIEYLDYRNHARYSEAEVRAFAEHLVSDGVLVAVDGEWRLAPGSPAASNRFVFTTPG